MKEMTKEELNFLIIGIRLQIDECDKQIHNYDTNVRNIYEEKRKDLYKLWDKLEKSMNLSTN